jgi:hypothetical protein
MLPKLFLLIALLTFVSIASASWIFGADSGYLGIYNTGLSNGEKIQGYAPGFVVSGMVEYDFLEFLGARVEAGYASATEGAKYSFYYSQSEADIEFKPYFCASLPVILPNIDWDAGSGKNKLAIIVAPGLTYSILDANRKFLELDHYSGESTIQVVDFESKTPDLTGIVGVRCTLFNGISIWTEFKIWGEHLVAAKGTPAPLQIAQDVTVRTFVLGAGYNFF